MPGRPRVSPGFQDDRHHRLRPGRQGGPWRPDRSDSRRNPGVSAIALVLDPRADASASSSVSSTTWSRSCRPSATARSPRSRATVGMTLVFANGHQLIWGPDAEPFPPIISGYVTVGSVQISWQSIIIWVVLAVVVSCSPSCCERTKLGRGMIASATDPLAATTVGVNVSRDRSLSFALAFGLAAIAGVLVAPITLAGGGGLGTALTLKGFTGAVLGGLDSTRGVVVGCPAARRDREPARGVPAQQQRRPRRVRRAHLDPARGSQRPVRPQEAAPCVSSSTVGRRRCRPLLTLRRGDPLRRRSSETPRASRSGST